jgi:hypothetical protein
MIALSEALSKSLQATVFKRSAQPKPLSERGIHDNETPWPRLG